MSWRDRIARVLRLGGRAQPGNLKPWPADDIDPIEELARIIDEAQEQDAQDEGRFDEIGSERPRPRRAITRPPRQARPF